MWRAVAIAAVAGGCYNPHPAANTPCGPGDACPTPLMCDRGLCVLAPSPADAPPDTPIDAPDGPDGDDDGVLDSQDNCPAIANANQHDEDTDERGDVCDGCPHVPQSSFVDGDGDGVDDPCDPNPGMGGDSIAAFLPFDTLPTTGVTFTGSAWATSNDALRQTDAAGTVSLTLNDTHASEVTLEIAGSIDSVAGTSRELKVVAGRVSAGDFHSCCFDDTDGTSVFTLEIEDENGTGAGTIILTQPARPDRLDLGAFRLRIEADPGTDTVDCYSMEGGDVVTANSTAATTMPAGQVGLISNRVTYSLLYLVVFKR